jgi:predicted dehydrogenase
MSAPLKIGIVGARGIGRHQAKWFAQIGCEVVAIYGTSEATATTAAEGVRRLFGFDGRVECDWERFIEAADIDAVTICSPPEAHVANVGDALRAGKHVLCEKPLVWDWNASPDDLRSGARELVAAARSAGRVFAVNAQYPAAVEPLLELFTKANSRAADRGSLAIRMETAGPPRSPHGASEVWADLGPHPLAVADRLLAGGTPDLSSARRESSDTDAVVHVEWNRSGRRVPVTLELRRIRDKAAVRREFTLDGWTAAYQARNIDGEFKAALVSGEHEWVGEDFMRASIRRFAEAARSGDPARALLTGEDALRQFEIQVAIWEKCFR